MSRIAKPLILLLSILVFGYVGLGYVLGQTTDDQTYRALTVYSEVLQRIQQDYVEDADIKLVTVGALHGMLESLDPESSYLSPTEFADYKKKRANEDNGDVGLSLSKRFGYVIVLSSIPGSPAEKAGLRPGDILESIAGFSTREMSIGQAEVLLSGDPGAAVTVELLRRGRGDAQKVDLVRARLKEPPIVHLTPAEGIAYLRLPTLDKGKAEELREKLVMLDQKGTHKLILDLRETSSGDAAEAIAAARLFLNSGEIATLRGQTVSPEKFTADPSKIVWKYPVAVLTAGSTSGAAEILAAAIRGNNRGPVIGSRTFGTASQQKLFTLEDGAALFLTIAKYYTPDGASIPEEGVAPLVEVSTVFEDDSDFDLTDRPGAARLGLPDNPAVQKAIEILNTPPAAIKAARLTDPSSNSHPEESKSSPKKAAQFAACGSSPCVSREV